MEVKEIIRRGRHAKHWTQAELAAAVGVSVSAVKQWETGRCVPSAWACFNLSANLGVPLAHMCKERPKIMRTPRTKKNETPLHYQKPAILLI